MYAIRPCLDSCLFVLNHELIIKKHIYLLSIDRKLYLRSKCSFWEIKSIILFVYQIVYLLD